MTVFKIVGKVVNSNSKKGIKGLKVEAWDKDLLVNDLIGSATTEEGGVFRIQFDESYFKELFLDRRPDLFFKVFKESQLIQSTEGSVLWNLDSYDIEQTIEVEGVNGMTTAKNNAAFIRQRGSEVFKFITIRPFQRQDEASIRKRKVPCYEPLEDKSEFHQSLLEAKTNPPEGVGPREAMIAEAEAFIASDLFIHDIDDLWKPGEESRSAGPSFAVSKSALGALEEWYFHSRKPILHDLLLVKIKEIYQADNLNSIVEDPEFQNDRSRLRDSIMALTIIPSHPHSQRDQLVNALRLCRVIERMAAGDSDLINPYGIDRALKAPVVLPTDIYPLPPAKSVEIEVTPEQGEEQEAMLSDLREKRNVLITAIKELSHLRSEDYTPPPQLSSEESDALKFRKDDIKKLSASTMEALKEFDIDLTKETIPRVIIKLKSDRSTAEETKALTLQLAMEELFNLFSSRHPKPTKRKAVEKEEITTAEAWKPCTLTQDAFGRLLDTTIQTVQELGFDLARDPAPDVVNALEEELARVVAQLYIPPRRKKMIRHGASRFEFLPGFENSPWSPEELEPIRVPQTKGLVQPIGFGEYNIVQQSLLRYEPGEVAHIENVLRGEYKERVHRRLRRFEEELTYEEERKAVTEKNLQSTDRFELKREASETIKEEHKAEAGVAVKYDGPMVDVEANAGYTYTHAKEQAKKTSLSYAREVTQRSLSRLEEKVREVRMEKSIEEFEETNTHGIDNKEKPDHAVGVYRWVDKTYEAQVIGYGQRLFFDFTIPEPAAFYLYALTRGATDVLQEPVPPVVDENGEPCGKDDSNARPLSPDDIGLDNYLHWVTRYQVSDVEQPPRQYIRKGYAYSKEAEQSGEGARNIYESKTIPIPEGYQALFITVRGSSTWCGVLAYYIDIVGISHPLCRIDQTVSLLGSGIYVGEKGEQSGEHKPGVPISIEVLGATGYVMNVSLFCQRTPELLKQWQLNTYEAIIQAYLNKKAEYDEKLAMAAIQEGISISGRNPAQNREIEETELKRWALSMITGQHFELFNAMQTDRQGYPGVDFAEADAEGPYIQFFEHAFEWPLMTYVFYPYFWGKRQAGWQGGPSWIDKITSIQDVDPLFEKFLKAGAARVKVPVRPGFEEAIAHYLATTEIWNGSEKPTLDEDLYLSMVEEIQQQQGAYVEKSEGTLSVEQGSTLVVGTETNFIESDVDREIYIESKRYVIAEVQDAEHLTLTESYRGETSEHARYYIGARLVGGPWEVRIPTALVHLQQDATLPDFTEENE